MKLTQKNVDQLKPGDKEYRQYFDGLAGFGIKVYPSGMKSYFVDYSLDGKRHRVSLAQAQYVTAKEAKERYNFVKLQVANGGNPLGSNDEQDPTGPIPMADAFRKYIRYISSYKLNTKADRSYLSDLLFTVGGTVYLKDVTRADVLRAHSVVLQRGPVAANRFRTSVCTFFNWAVEMGYIEKNPAAKIKGIKEQPRERVLSEEEMYLLKESIKAEDDFTRVAFTVMINTGCRQGEILKANWSEFDLDGGWWTIPACHSKNNKTQVIPINAETVRALAEIQPLKSLGQQFGFPVIRPSRRTATGHRASLQAAWERIKGRVGLPEDLNMHDIRRTFGLKICLEHGIHVASKLLRHSSIKITERAYAPLGVEERGKEILRSAVEG